MKFKALPTLLLATVMLNVFQPITYAGKYQSLTVKDVENFIDSTAAKYDWKELTFDRKINPRNGKLLKASYKATISKRVEIYAYLDYSSRPILNAVSKTASDCTKKIIYTEFYQKLNGKLVTVKSKQRMSGDDYGTYCNS